MDEMDQQTINKSQTQRVSLTKTANINIKSLYEFKFSVKGG